MRWKCRIDKNMRKRIPIVCCILVLLFPAQLVPADDVSPEQIREAMREATDYLCTASTRGGYAGIYSTDLKRRYGEGLYHPMDPTEIWVQPPGTPSVGECFLRAYRITGESQYLKAAREAGRALVWGQRKAGGWEHTADVAYLKPDSVSPERKKGACTFDDNITQGALSFLISLDEVIEEEWLSEAIRIGLDHMLQTQFKNGAWPQWNPLKWYHHFFDGYHDYYTFNDGAINDCISIMLRVHKAYNREEYLRSATRGGDFIISSQRASPQAGWAQQYSDDMKPAWARAFEPPGVCSAVTARNIKTLVDLYLYAKDEKYLAPIPSAIEWLESSRIGDNLWSRLYELDTNKPIYGDRDGEIHYNYDEISEERKRGYGWRGEFGVSSAIEYYETVKQSGAAGYIGERSKALTPAQRKQRAEHLAKEVGKIIATLDESGRWVEENMIFTGTFVRNFNLLCEYLEMRNAADKE